MDAETWINIFGSLGFPIALVWFLLKRDSARDKESSEREKRLGDRIDELEDRHSKELVGLVAKTTAAIRDQNSKTARQTRSIEALIEVLRPVVAPTGQTTVGQQMTPSDHIPSPRHHQQERDTSYYENTPAEG